MEKPVKPVLNKEKPVSCLKLWNILTGLLLTIGYFGKINFWTIFSKYVFLFIYQSFYVFVSDNLGSGAVWGKSANRGGPRSHPLQPLRAQRTAPVPDQRPWWSPLPFPRWFHGPGHHPRVHSNTHCKFKVHSCYTWELCVWNSQLKLAARLLLPHTHCQTPLALAYAANCEWIIFLIQVQGPFTIVVKVSRE